MVFSLSVPLKSSAESPNFKHLAASVFQMSSNKKKDSINNDQKMGENDRS